MAHKPRILIKNRVSNVRHTLRREVNIVRDLVGDLKTRIGAGTHKEPRSTARIGGLLGRRGSLIKTIPDAMIRTADNLIEHQQNFASINRRHLHRRG